MSKSNVGVEFPRPFSQKTPTMSFVVTGKTAEGKLFIESLYVNISLSEADRLFPCECIKEDDGEILKDDFGVCLKRGEFVFGPRVHRVKTKKEMTADGVKKKEVEKALAVLNARQIGGDIIRQSEEDKDGVTPEEEAAFRQSEEDKDGVTPEEEAAFLQYALAAEISVKEEKEAA